jgi:hypothetical protein
VHDSFQGAQIFDSETLLKLPNARIPYNGPSIVIPVLYLETGTILVGENGDISVYDSEGLLLGILGVKAGKHAVTPPLPHLWSLTSHSKDFGHDTVFRGSSTFSYGYLCGSR